MGHCLVGVNMEVCIFAFVCDLLSAWLDIRHDEINLWESL